SCRKRSCSSWSTAPCGLVGDVPASFPRAGEDADSTVVTVDTIQAYGMVAVPKVATGSRLGRGTGEPRAPTEPFRGVGRGRRGTARDRDGGCARPAGGRGA